MKSFFLSLAVLALFPYAQSFAAENAPEFALKDLNGRFHSLTAKRGSVIVLNFWATWCPPCREEIPVLNEIHSRYGGRGVVVLGISADPSAEKIKAFMEETPIKYPVLLDPGAKVSKLYRVSSIPTTFIVDKSGSILRRYHVFTEAELGGKIEELIR